MASGLEHARHPEGIERLANRYVEISRPDRNAGPRAVAASRELLTTALVGFAEKMVFVANHDVLEDSGTRPTGAVNRYRIILQAIGNALMVQADDIKRFAEHQKGLNDRAEAERWALEHAIGRSAEAFLLSLVADARQEAQKAATAAEQATEVHAKAKKDFDAKTAANAEAQRTKEQATAAAANAPNTARPRHATIKKASDVLSTHTAALKTALGDEAGNGAAALSQLTGLLQSYSQDAKDTAAYLDSGDIKTSITNISTKPKKAVFDDILSLVARQLTVAKSFANTEESEATRLATAKRSAETDAAARQNALNEATKEQAKAQADLTEKKAKVEPAQTLADTIAGYQVALARRKDGGARSPYDGYQDIRDTNDKALTTARAKTPQVPAEITKLEAAKKFIDDHNPPLSLSRVPAASTRPGENARDVLDSLIMSLRDEHILTIRESGEESARAKSVAAALKAAYDHRGGMAYLRPAIAYLRSSYAATSLQEDGAAAGWRNLLQESGGRAMPFISEGVANWGKEEKLKITAEIDKQFWHNINSVRVSGAGLTNYVMVKDDIGNWYVKQYSADPTSIINSAKSLAMFNLGVPGVPTPAPKPADPAGPAAATPDTTPPLERLVKRYKDSYVEHTKQVYDTVMKLDDTLPESIAASWDADKELSEVRERLKAHLDKEQATLRADLAPLKTVKPEGRGDAIVDALRAGRRFHGSLTAAIRIQLRGEKDAGPAAKAADYATVAARAVLGEHLRARKESVAEYSRSITFIGDASK